MRHPLTAVSCAVKIMPPGFESGRPSVSGFAQVLIETERQRDVHALCFATTKKSQDLELSMDTSETSRVPRTGMVIGDSSKFIGPNNARHRIDRWWTAVVSEPLRVEQLVGPITAKSFSHTWLELGDEMTIICTGRDRGRLKIHVLTGLFCRTRDPDHTSCRQQPTWFCRLSSSELRPATRQCNILRDLREIFREQASALGNDLKTSA